MTDKNRKLTKRVATFTWVYAVVLFVTYVLALVGMLIATNTINASPERFPEGFSMTVGLGLALFLIYGGGISNGLLITFSIPSSILKSKSAKANKTSVADLVFTFLMLLVSIPAIICGAACADVIFELLSYGIGKLLLPFVPAVVLNVVLWVFLLIQLIKCWPKKQKAEVAE